MPLLSLGFGFGFGFGFGAAGGGGIARTSLSDAATSLAAARDSGAVGGVTGGGLHPYPASRAPSSGAQRGSACRRTDAAEEFAEEEEEEEEEETEVGLEIERASQSSG